MQLFEDTTYPGELGSNSALFAPPSSGIGLAPQSSAPAPAKEELSGLGKIGLALQEAGAGFTGRPSPIDAHLKRVREDRLRKLQEFRIETDALKDGISMAENFTGKTREDYVEKYAQRLDGVHPGAGDTFRIMGKEPGLSKWIMENAAQIPELAAALEIDPSGKTAKELVKTPRFLERMGQYRDNKQLDLVLKKGRTFKLAWEQVAPPEMVERFKKDGELSASEVLEANDWIKANRPDNAAITFNDAELQTIRRLGDSVWTPLGILPNKSDLAIREDAAKNRAKPKENWSEPYELNGALVQKNDVTGQVRTAVSRPPVTNVNTVIKENDKKFEKEDKLRNDYTANPKVKASAEMDSAFKMIEAAYKNPTAANDLAMATKYMKILDPTSVVRESEFAMAVSATGLLDKVQNYAASILEGKRLNPAQRKDFYDSAKAINDTFQQGRAAVDTEYSEIATGYGLEPKNVIPSLRTKKTVDKQAETPPPPPGFVVNKQKKK